MLSQTLQDGLTDYAIGAKMRALRLKKKMGLVELGKHTGLSPALLSKIERGRLFPTLPTLLRIALVFSVGLEFFFARRAREAARRGGAQGGARAAARAAGRARVAYDSSRSTTRRPSGGSTRTTPSSSRCRRAAAAARPSGRRVHLRAAGHAERAHRRRRACARQRATPMYFDSSVPHAYRRSGGRGLQRDRRHGDVDCGTVFVPVFC